MQQKEFTNLLYDKCYILNESDNNYLIYAPKCMHNFIVCSYIDDMGTMTNQVFFDKLPEALEFFEEKKEKNNGRIL